MASVYDADANAVFRCSEVSYPQDGLFVAFWTPFVAGLLTQPAPINCGDFVELANPLTGVTAVAVVLDRCASCVGVGNALDDSTVPNTDINGATVDLSRALWNKLYDSALDSVFDVLYSGQPLQGSDSLPAKLPN